MVFSLTFMIPNTKGGYDRQFAYPVEVSFPDATYTQASDLVVDQSGGLIAGGWARRVMSNGKEQTVFALCRFLPSGVLDKKFGVNGTVLYEFSKGQNARITTMAIDSSNRIIAAGCALVDKKERVAIAKIDAVTGRPIASFGAGGGLVFSSLIGDDIERARDIALDHGDGSLYISCLGDSPFLIHLLSNGTIDSVFNHGEPLAGYVPSTCSWAHYRHPIALDYVEGSLWGIVAGGVIKRNSDSSGDCMPHLYLGRFSKDAEPDYNFAHEGECGVNGWKRYDQWIIASLAAIAVDSERGYVSAATASSTDTEQFFLMRCNTDEYGSDLDSGFGAGGVVMTAFPDSKAQRVSDMIIDSGGNIIVAGLAIINDQARVALAFHDNHGHPITTVGSKDGCLLVDYGAPFLKTTRVSALAEYGDGRLAILTDGQCSRTGDKIYSPKDLFLTTLLVWALTLAFMRLP